MANNEYVTVRIDRETTFPRQAAFDTLAFVCSGASFAPGETHRYYERASDADQDNDLDAAAKGMLRAAFSQTQHVPRIAVIPLANGGAPVPSEYTIAPISGALDLSVRIVAPDGDEHTVTGSDPADAGAALADLASNIDAISGLGATVSGGVIEVEGTDPGAWLIYPGEGIASVLDVTPDAGYDLALAEAQDAGLSFYGVCIDINSPANILKVASWALANIAVFYAGPQATKAAEFVPTAQALKSQNNERVYTLLTKPRNEFAACALAAYMRSLNPGSATYAFKNLRGVSVDNWGATDEAALKEENVNLYIDIGGSGGVSESKTAGGEDLDIIEGVDLMVARIGEAVLALLKQRDKVPFTDAGIVAVANQVKSALDRAASPSWQIIDPDSIELFVPRALDVDPADRAQRRLDDIRWRARLQGAIHYVTVSGAVAP